MCKWWAQICTSTTPTQLSILLIHARWAHVLGPNIMSPLKVDDFDWTIVGPKKGIKEAMDFYSFPMKKGMALGKSKDVNPPPITNLLKKKKN